jgi:hypothetical protein
LKTTPSLSDQEILNNEKEQKNGWFAGHPFFAFGISQRNISGLISGTIPSSAARLSSA